MEIRCPKTEMEWDSYYDLRYRILRQPWNQPRGSERNEGDYSAIHAAYFQNGVIKGVARLDLMDNEIGQIRFMAVETDSQGKRIGEKLMVHLEDLAFQNGRRKIILHAREIALGFYQKLGYEIVEKSHLLFGEIQHYLMEKAI
ncbi:MAG: GNAT family N-acetyltransferase [Bacteroidetes bacterium]|nr:GNAT family N-acetyltransferase [Bacteroidota bacterium]